MAIEFEAVYENGVLKPTTVLPFREHEKVQGTIQTESSLARQTAGMIPWKEDAETLERIATDPEFGISESPWPSTTSPPRKWRRVRLQGWWYMMILLLRR
jgi:predicted DNA-binding antitoxin AbrB/MazE fold protein